MNKDTPRTTIEMEDSPHLFYVHASFARELERELNYYKRMYEEQKQKVEEYEKQYGKPLGKW